MNYSGCGCRLQLQDDSVMKPKLHDGRESECAAVEMSRLNHRMFWTNGLKSAEHSWTIVCGWVCEWRKSVCVCFGRAGQALLNAGSGFVCLVSAVKWHQVREELLSHKHTFNMCFLHTNWQILSSVCVCVCEKVFIQLGNSLTNNPIFEMEYF